MFHTTLLDEYSNALHMGLNESELLHLIDTSFHHAFAHENQKTAIS